MAHTSNVFFDKGTFNSAQGDFHIHNGDVHNGDSESGLRELKLGVSLGAIHDSAERSPAPNCHPGTRNAVRKIILNWIRSETWDSSFFWLYGPAGAGKTAILQAIAEFLCSQSGFDENFGGSFFFSRGKTGRDQGHFLFSTIAYQLALNDVTGLHGLDECHDKATQQSILRLLCETITVHKLPLRFLIGSRPESHIRASFDQESLYTITHRVILDESFNPARDIQVFLQGGFAKICAENSIPSLVERPWPGEGIIDLLVQRSSGQFIYAATVLKFVGADFCSPTKQLALVLKPDPTAFSDLDQLYTQILSVYPSAVNIVRVLGIIVTIGGGRLEVFEDILEMEEGELKLVLRGLSSLMDEKLTGESLNKGVVYFAHASFGDYLLDSSRSGPFHVNQQEYESQVTIRGFALIMQSIWSQRMSSATPVPHTATWDYFISRLWDRFGRSPNVEKEATMTVIDDLLQEFWRSSRDVEASFVEMRRVLKILQKCFDDLDVANHNSLDDQIRAKFKILVDEYRKMFDQSLSKSKDLGDMLRLLPGVVVQKQMSMQGMVDLYRIKPDFLDRLVKSTIKPLNLHKAFPNSRYILDEYLSGYLQDRDRSHFYYCDPILQHISICRHFLSLLDGSRAFDSRHELSDYVNFHFYDHLCASTTVSLNAQDVFDNHPTVEILCDLETIGYYVYEISGYLAQHIIQSILRWTDILNCHLKGVDVSVSIADLMERVCHLTNKIYREILCITKHERTQMTYITMGQGGLDHVQVFAFSWTLPCLQYKFALSWDLLARISVEGRIPCSFTNFITTPELSGPLYISPDIYHTQITEYSLKAIHPLSDYFLIPDLSLHFSRALPTEMIFYLLRSIPSERLTPDRFGELKLDALEIIIKWLQVGVSER